MTSGLLQLLVLTLRGRVIRFLRQLRQPKYLIGFVIGVAWLSMWLFGWSVGRESQGLVREMLFSGAYERMRGDLTLVVELAFSIGFVVVLTVAWLLPAGKLGLPLKEAELQLLLPAPISRRRLIQYALFKAQFSILLTMTIVSLFLGSGRLGQQLRIMLALWLILTSYDIYGKWNSLFRLRLRQLPTAVAWRRRAIVLGVVVAIWGVLATRLLPLGRDLIEMIRNGGGYELILSAIVQTGGDTALRVVLQPIRWVVGPAFAGEGAGFWLALLPSLAVLIALHELLVRSSARFEEAAIESARKEETGKSPTRRWSRQSSSSRRRVPFVLRPTGMPEVAITWKNLIQVSRIPLRVALPALLGGLVLLALALACLPIPPFVFGVVAFFGAFDVVFTPFVGMTGSRNDLRTELRHLELVRTWPVPGHRLVLAQVVTVTMQSLLYGLIGTGLLAVAIYGLELRAAVQGRVENFNFLPRGNADLWGLPPMLTAALCLLSVLPVLVGAAAVVSTMQNLATLMFPAWVGLGPKAAKGLSNMGQTMLVGVVLMLSLLLATLPGAILIGLGLLALWGLSIPWHALLIPLFSILGALPFFVEVALLVRVGGKLWDQLDPSGEVFEAAA